MKIELNDDRTVSLTVEGKFDVAELTALLHRLGEARAKIADDPVDPTGLAIVPSTRDTSWWIAKTATGSSFAFRSYLYGWIGIELTPADRGWLLYRLAGHQLEVPPVEAASVSAGPGSGGGTR